MTQRSSIKTHENTGGVYFVILILGRVAILSQEK
jgi:hypothetical protein